MVPIEKVRFRRHEGTDICEIHLPDGNNVAVFPAGERMPGADPAQTYGECYRAAFDAFKAGKPQPFEIAAQEAAKASESAESGGAVSGPDNHLFGFQRRNEPAGERKAAKKGKAAKKAGAKAKKSPTKKAAKKAAKAKR